MTDSFFFKKQLFFYAWKENTFVQLFLQKNNGRGQGRCTYYFTRFKRFPGRVSTLSRSAHVVFFSGSRRCRPGLLEDGELPASTLLLWGH